MTETVEGRWAPFATALREEFAGELAGPLACCEPGADVMFEHDGPCSLMDGPEVVETGAEGVTPADIMAVDPEVESPAWWHEELQFAAHGEIFELSVQGESLLVYTNGTRHRPEHGTQLENVAPRAVAAEIHRLVTQWVGPCAWPDSAPNGECPGAGDPAGPISLPDDVAWVWEWFPGWLLCDDVDMNGWDLYSRAEYLNQQNPPALYGSAPGNATAATLARLTGELTDDHVTGLNEATPFIINLVPQRQRKAWARVVHVHVAAAG